MNKRPIHEEFALKPIEKVSRYTNKVSMQKIKFALKQKEKAKPEEKND